MHVVSIASVKGGVGKSATAISLSYMLATRGRRVLLIDADPQNATTSHFFPDEQFQHTLSTVLHEECTIADAARPIGVEGIHVLPSELELADIAGDIDEGPTRWFLMHNALKEVAAHFDNVVIDTPPSRFFTTRLSLIASDAVIIPTQLDKWAVRGVNTTLKDIKSAIRDQKLIQRQIDAIAVVPTFFEENRQIKELLLDQVRENFSRYVTNVMIHRATEIEKTYSIDNEQLSSSTRAYQEYEKLLNELVSRGVIDVEA
jgi:chromosome partitioning protein